MSNDKSRDEARAIVGQWGYEEPYWWEPIAAALDRREAETWERAIGIAKGLESSWENSRNNAESNEHANMMLEREIAAEQIAEWLEAAAAERK